MGLDMYLYAYDEKVEQALKKALDPDTSDDETEGLMDLVFDNTTEVAYWRKANAIHDFFCREGKEVYVAVLYVISREVLEKLLEKCFQVLVLKDEEFSKETLPTRSGFFFGSTEYGEFYYENIRYTTSQIAKALANYDDEEFLYYASW